MKSCRRCQSFRGNVELDAELPAREGLLIPEVLVADRILEHAHMHMDVDASADHDQGRQIAVFCLLQIGYACLGLKGAW